MKIIISQENLKRAVNIVDKIVSRNTTLPILGNILIKTESGRLKLSTTNLEIGINYLIGAKIDEVGEVAVPAKIFSDFINNINGERVSLTTKNNILYINSPNYKTQILGSNSQDFPIIPKIKSVNPYIISPKLLKNCLATVFDSISISETRPELAGVLIKFDSNKIIFVATDSFRLTEKWVDFKNNYNFSVILPRNTVAELIGVCDGIEDDLTIHIQDNQISFSNDDVEVISRVVDGAYPDYKKVIPDKFISRVKVKKEDLEKNVRLAGLFSSSISDVKILAQKDFTQIIAKNSDKGEIETKINSTLVNEPFDTGLNFHYLLDGLKAISTDDVIIEFTGPGSPIILKPNQDKPDTIYLIMPLRNAS